MTRSAMPRRWWTRAAVLALVGGAACRSTGTPGRTAGGEAADTGRVATPADTAAAPPRRVAVIRNLEHPEAARYDAELGLWFVANINGDPLAKDNNGYISRFRPDGSADSLKFIAGGRGGVTLNAPKGMAIVGDTLWVADIDAARAFNKRTGAPLGSVSLAGRAKFLNDAVAGPDGIYLTDTGVGLDAKKQMTHTGPDRVFRIGKGRRAELVLESPALEGPNGIAWDSAGRSFVIVPFFGKTLVRWTPGEKSVRSFATGPGQQDGVEVLGPDRILVTAWADSSLFVVQGGKTSRLLSDLPSPADLGLDPVRGRVAVPLLLEDRVEIWELPPERSAAGPPRAT